MAVELGASRLLAPFFSSLQIVWTIIIGTIMIAMALGNLYGGRSADKKPNPDILFWRICISSVWLALIPVIGKYVILFIQKNVTVSINNTYLVACTFVTCIVLFVFPLFLLGTVTLSLVKYSVKDLDKNGTIVGRLYACNTIGCILGTFIPTFVSIPTVGTSVTFLIFSGLLLIVSCIYFIYSLLYNKKKTKLNYIKIFALCLSVIIFVICCIFGYKTSYVENEENVKYEGESVYNYLLVRGNNSAVNFTTSLNSYQSVWKKDGNLSGLYYDYALAAPFMANIPEKSEFNILILGNGAGTYASLCKELFGEKVNIDAVEIDEKITELGYEYFDMSHSINVYSYDGRAYLNATDKLYDVILVDAYRDLTIPFHMATKEFFEQVRNHLTEDGVMVANVASSNQNFYNLGLYLPDTISTAFKNVYFANVKNTSNTVVFASNNSLIYDRRNNDVEILNLGDISQKINEVYNSLLKQNFEGYVFTDDRGY